MTDKQTVICLSVARVSIRCTHALTIRIPLPPPRQALFSGISRRFALLPTNEPTIRAALIRSPVRAQGKLKGVGYLSERNRSRNHTPRPGSCGCPSTCIHHHLWTQWIITPSYFCTVRAVKRKMYLQASLMVHARLAALPQIFAQPDRRLAQRAVHTD